MKHLEKNPWVRVLKTREQQLFGISQAYCPELYKAIWKKVLPRRQDRMALGSISAGHCGS